MRKHPGRLIGLISLACLALLSVFFATAGARARPQTKSNWMKGLLDPRAEPDNLRRLVPRTVPSGRPVLIFEFP